jgi:hypothetical protein
LLLSLSFILTEAAVAGNKGSAFAVAVKAARTAAPSLPILARDRDPHRIVDCDAQRICEFSPLKKMAIGTL